MSNGLINRQYVGARYVPKIMGEWNKTLQYEALSVVTYMGNSFTSKVPVPANIEIDNEDYWVSTGNYNAQVENYRKETKVCRDLLISQYNNVNEMINSDSIKLNDFVITKGYYNTNDGGSTLYFISTSKNETSIELKNGLYANILNNGRYISLCSFGAIDSDINNPIDDILDKAIKYCCESNIELYIPANEYYVNRTHTLNSSIIITGDYIKSESNSREVKFNFIYTGSDYLFALENTSAYFHFNGISIKCNYENNAIKTDSYRNTFENLLIFQAKEGIYLTRSNSEQSGVTYENKINNCYFFNNTISIKTDYKRGTSTDGYITDNIFISSDGKESYSIKSTVMSEWIISRNHDYSTNGINIGQAIHLIITENYFDNTDKTSIDMIINGDVIISNNKFLTKNGTDSTKTFTKVLLKTSLDYKYAKAIFTNNLMTDVDGIYTANAYLINCQNVHTCIVGNLVNGKAKIVSPQTDAKYVQEESLNNYAIDISSRFKFNDNITGTVYAIYCNNYIELQIKFNSTTPLTAYSISILKSGFPAPYALRSRKVDYYTFSTNNNTFAFNNEGTGLISFNDLEANKNYVLNVKYYTNDLDLIF